MGWENRISLLQQISNIRGSQVISYITGDRENINTRIAPDVIKVFYRHLEMGQKGLPIDILLYTRGGDVLTPWRLVHLIREYTDRFSVLVPFKAYSAGTLICLGSDEIVMGKMGELGPIDPSVVNAFNPQDPSNPSSRVPVNIEDVYSYLALVREKAGVEQQEELAKIIRLLGEKIHPLALGNVHRNWLLIRSLAQRLLNLRQELIDENKVKNIIYSLTEKLYAHNHMIPRREALFDIGLHVHFADETLDRLMWKLYEDYAMELKLAEPFDPSRLLKGSRTEFEVPGGIVESLNGDDYFIFKGVVEHQDYREGGQININIFQQGWRTVN